MSDELNTTVPDYEDEVTQEHIDALNRIVPDSEFAEFKEVPMQRTAFKWPRACHEIRAPFSKNYCRDWLLYHGGIFSVGLLAIIVWHNYGIALAVGGGLMLVAMIVGAVNYLCDRSFRKEPKRAGR